MNILGWSKDMFDTKEFMNVNEANDYICATLAAIGVPNAMEFQVIHSIANTECVEDGGRLEAIEDIMLNYLRDLDAQQGYMGYDDGEETWDFMECDEPNDYESEIYKPTDPDEQFVFAGEGVAVVHNLLAVCESQFPIIVFKKSFLESQRFRTLEMLKYCTQGDDYTSKISPAIYIEMFFPNGE